MEARQPKAAAPHMGREAARPVDVTTGERAAARLTSSTKKSTIKLLTFRKNVGPQALSDFFDHLATLLSSGIPLLQALEFVRGATRNQRLKVCIKETCAKVRAGAPFSDSLADHPEIFDRVVHGMLRAAEASGNVEAISKELARSFSRQAEMRSRILQALAYPALVAAFGFITVCVLLVYVVPKLTSVFELWDTPLPFVTRILLNVSTFLSHGGFIAFGSVAVGILLALKLLGPIRRKQLAYRAVVNIPFLKSLFFLTDFVRLSQTWGMLLRSGVPLIEAIRSTEDVIWDPRMRASLGVLREKTVKGSALQEAISEEPWFPELAKNFLAIGEETGTLDDSFEKIAAFFERELDRKVKILGTYLEPMLILAIGLVVGFLVISMLLPIFEMSLVVQ